MTNKEAREQLNLMKVFIGYDVENPLVKRMQSAIDRAIKALKQQPCEDCISRQKALDCFEQTNTRQGAKYAIETLPSVTPTSEDIKEAYLKGYDYGVKDWFKSKTQPCEDCVSRADVKEQMLKYGFNAPDMTVTEFVEDCLPSVTPQPKKGKWIGCKCSKCNYEVMGWNKNNFCPNCGAEMEVEE